MNNYFGARGNLQTPAGRYQIYRLEALDANGQVLGSAEELQL